MPTLKLFTCTNPRCHENGQDFGFSSTDAEPPCPKCGVAYTDPRKIVRRLVMIHFDPPSDVPGFGCGHRACDPKVHIAIGGGPNGDQDWLPNPYHAGTGDPMRVTCPACRASDAWKTALAEAYEEGPGMRVAMARLRAFAPANA